MSESEFHLRLQSPCDKEHKSSAVTVTDTAQAIPTALTGGFRRKRLVLYNNSDSGSGELLYGSGECLMVAPRGTQINVPVSPVTGDFEVFVKMKGSGEFGDLRVWECS